ncbi:hypothetical protein BJX96DRAFT_177658 [Aspergillus floccosus]
MAQELDILLELAGDDGAEYRNRNDGAEIEREVVIDRGEDIFVGCDLLPVIHGQMDPEDEVPASLVVFDFHFQGSARKKRFISAHISVVFADEESPGNPRLDPIVREISFAPTGASGRHSIIPTVHQKEVRRAVSLSSGGSAFGVEIKGGVFYEVSETVKKHDSAFLEARKRVLGRAVGKKNAAEWLLLENESRRDGIPPFMRVAVLLERQSIKGETRRFTGTVSVDARVAMGHRVSDVWNALGMRKVPPVDPVIFNPERRRRMEDIIDADANNLRAAKVEDIGVLLGEVNRLS